MPITFQLNIHGPERLFSALKQIPIRDWSEAWVKVIAQLADIGRRQFESAGALGTHGRWAELSPNYAKRKKRVWGEKPILQASGKLQSALLEGGLGHFEELEPLRMSFGVSADAVPYALYHQTGSSKMAARPILDWTQQDHLAIQKTLESQALDSSRRLGFKVASAPGSGRAAPGLSGPPARGFLLGESQLNFPF